MYQIKLQDQNAWVSFVASRVAITTDKDQAEWYHTRESAERHKAKAQEHLVNPLEVVDD